MVDRAVKDLVHGALSGAAAAPVKLFCTELQRRMVDRCLELAGPAAHRNGSPLGRAYLDRRVSRIYGGSSEIMKVIAAQLLGL
jgi:acyl-CoA dehydrogenase